MTACGSVWTPCSEPRVIAGLTVLLLICLVIAVTMRRRSGPPD